MQSKSFNNMISTLRSYPRTDALCTLRLHCAPR
uniref:Uncharacterized protein n=1 Tax=Arundo donax TaxID=35708 RepID=A0A0A9C6L0_ARUDO